MTDTPQKKPIYECPECGLHYNDEEIMKKCQVWCAKYSSCNLEIIQHAIESQEKQPS